MQLLHWRLCAWWPPRKVASRFKLPLSFLSFSPIELPIEPNDSSLRRFQHFPGAINRQCLSPRSVERVLRDARGFGRRAYATPVRGNIVTHQRDWQDTSFPRAFGNTFELVG